MRAWKGGGCCDDMIKAKCENLDFLLSHHISYQLHSLSPCHIPLLQYRPHPITYPSHCSDLILKIFHLIRTIILGHNSSLRRFCARRGTTLARGTFSGWFLVSGAVAFPVFLFVVFGWDGFFIGCSIFFVFVVTYDCRLFLGGGCGFLLFGRGRGLVKLSEAVLSIAIS